MMILFAIYLLFITLPAYIVPSSVGRESYGEVKLFQTPQAYNVDSTVLLNDASRRDKEISYKMKAVLNVLPVWAGSQFELLLKFELISPQLYARGKHANADYTSLNSVWDTYPHTAFFVHWNLGHILAAYLDPDEPVDIQNFKRSLISLFQFQVFDGESNETDVSGVCDVQYESSSATTVRKTKRRCRAADWPADSAGDEVRSRRLMRYTLNPELDTLRELHAEELHELGDAARGAGLKARVWMRLEQAPAPPDAARAASLSAALPSELRAVPLPAAPPIDLEAEPDYQAADAEPLGAAAAPGAGGTLRQARAALRVLAALRVAPLERLNELLHDGVDAQQLSGLCVALGLAGAAHTHAAAVRFLRLRQGDAPRALAHEYFAALGLSERPQDSVIQDALKLGEELQDVELAESALLGAAAAARRGSAAASRAVRDRLVRGLGRCADERCRRVRVAALGNLRRADAAEALLQHAERGSESAMEAMDALDGLLGALPPDAPPRLERLALGNATLEVRAAALDLLLRGATAAPFSLPRVLLALQAEGAHELQRLAWQRLRAVAAESEPVRMLLRLLPLRMRGWDAQALPGTSSLLVREAARGAGWRARLESLQLTRGALLRRGRVRLLAEAPDGRVDDTLSVELWTRGLQALAGGDADAEGEAAGGGLALAVGGARLRALTLFSGQAELLGHVWAGTGSEPTPVLRALRPLAGARAALPLLGGAALRYRREAVLALALDADAQVSLWARSARAHLALRGAVAARGAASVRTAWGELRAAAASETEPRLRISADLDFYADVALCVRVRTEDYAYSYNVTLTSEAGAARRRVRRARALRWTAAGRTLALGAPNDATCSAAGAADE